MVEVSKPVNLGQLSAELGGVALWSSGPDASGVTTVWGEVDSAALAGAVAAHVAEPTPDTPDVPSVEQLLADLLEAL